MHQYEHYLDFPLQQQHSRQDSLTSYVPVQAPHFFNLPRQVNNSPYLPSLNQKQKRIPSQSNHSISKFAFTQMSTNDQKQDEELIPICQQMLLNYKDEQSQRKIHNEAVTEATFKPNQLKKYLDQSKRGNCNLRKLLTDALISKSTKRIKPKNNTIQVDTRRTKTKYQKILEQFYCKKPKNQDLKQKLSIQKMPNYKQKYNEEKQQRIDSNRYIEELKKSLVKSKVANFEDNHKNNTNFEQWLFEGKKPLTKTFSTQALPKTQQRRTAGIQQKRRDKQQSRTMNRQISVGQFLNNHKQSLNKESNLGKGERWTKMSFKQRQERSLQKRRQKQNLGQQMNLQRQYKDCTFKPIINDFRAKKTQNTAGSYAKLYYQKLKHR